MSEFTASAREAASIGRRDQLRVLAKFEAGERVVFKQHNGPGFELSARDVSSKPRVYVPCVSMHFT